MWYCSSITCKGDNSWNIWELHWESKYNKSYTVILKMLYMYIYIGVDVREKSHTYTVQYLKCYIKVEKNSTFYISPKQTEEIYKLNGLMLRQQWMADYLWIHVVLSLFLYLKLLVYIYIILCIYHLYCMYWNSSISNTFLFLK